MPYFFVLAFISYSEKRVDNLTFQLGFLPKELLKSHLVSTHGL